MPVRSSLYHSTAVETIPTILQQGLESTGEGYRDPIEEDIQTVARQEQLQYPVVRQDCIFFYPSLSQTINMSRLNFEDYDCGLFGGPEGIIVVDMDGHQDELFVADFDFFSDCIDLQYMSESDDTIRSESYDAALQNYAESVTPLTAFDSIEELTKQFHIPEVLFEGSLPPDNIVEVILEDEILGSGWYSTDPRGPD